MGPDGDWDWDGSRSAVAYNSVDDEFLAVWEGNDDRPPLGPAEIEIFGQRLLGALGVGGSVTGLDGRRVTCRNQTIPQVLTLDFGTSTSFACTAGLRRWDCEAAGLVVAEGDRIIQRMGGVAD